MSSSGCSVAPRSVDVLPRKVARRVTRRDGLLPAVFALELLAGVAFGLAAHSGQASTTGVKARLTFAPVAQVTVVPSSAPAVGPAIGPLRPGTVRPPIVNEPVITVKPPVRHAPRNPFGVLVHAAS